MTPRLQALSRTGSVSGPGELQSGALKSTDCQPGSGPPFFSFFVSAYVSSLILQPTPLPLRLPLPSSSLIAAFFNVRTPLRTLPNQDLLRCPTKRRLVAAFSAGLPPWQMEVLPTMPSIHGERPVVLARGKPFSFESLDVTLPLSKLSNRLHSAVDRASHFELRLDYHLPVLLSQDSSEERRIAAAYLCHQPYRAVVSEASCQPFRRVLSTLLSQGGSIPPALHHTLETLLYGNHHDIDCLGAESPQQLVQAQSSAPGPSSAVSSRIAELVRKSTQQTLSMGEQRMLVSVLGRAMRDSDAVTADELPPIWLAPLIEPEHLIMAGANSPMVACEMVGKLCQEAITADCDVLSADSPLPLHRYIEVLQTLSPTLRSFDLVTRLLRSERPAPAPMERLARRYKLTTTVSHLARSLVLGGFLSNGIRYLERREGMEESFIVRDAREAGLPEPPRREVEELLEERLSREVSIFCHFVRSLMNAALLFPPELGHLRRQISELKQQCDEQEAQEVDRHVESMEAELESNTRAMLVELQHFALHVGRYRDGTRLYGELTSLA
ncbi:hypothetical protein ACQY0O_007239 [Thecaphora frezii]